MHANRDTHDSFSDSSTNAEPLRLAYILAYWGERVAEHRKILCRATWICSALLAFAVLFDLSGFVRTERFTGPFSLADEGSPFYAVEIGSTIPYLSIVGTIYSPTSLQKHGMRVKLDGRAMLSDSDHLILRHGRKFGIRGLSRELRFHLPPGVSNDFSRELVAEYKVRIHRTLFLVIEYSLLLILALNALFMIHSGKLARPLVSVRQTQIALWTFPVASILLIGGCGIYVLSILYGLWEGYALPTATIFKVVPGYDPALIEPYIPSAILLFAMLGALAAWLAAAGIVPTHPLRRTEVRLMRLWSVFGFPVILCLLVFSLSSGGWSGHVRAIDQNYLSVAGLVPYSDPRAFFTDAYMQAIWGQWDVLGTRRPIAESFRQLIVFVSQYSYVVTLLVQASILALLLFLASNAVAHWRGVWAAIGFIGLLLILARPFIPTTMTEPLGLIWSLLSLIFLVEAFRLQSMMHAFVGFLILAFALFTRMGSMFTIPFLVLWMVIVFGNSFASRVKILALCCVGLFGVVSFAEFLGYFYGSRTTVSGGNFALTACGLSLDTDWVGCTKRYQQELSALPDERAQVSFLLKKVRDNFLHEPTTMIGALVTNVLTYVGGLRRFVFGGYIEAYPRVSATAVLELLLVPGILFALMRKSTLAERIFWLLLALSTMLSAAVILRDDGWRALYVTHVFVAYFVALGFVAPGVVSASSKRPLWQWKTGLMILAGGAAAFVAVPRVSQEVMARNLAGYSAVETPDDENIILAGKHISGFLVLPNDQEGPATIPVLKFSTFELMARASLLDDDIGPFVADVKDRGAFAFVLGVRLDRKFSHTLYIAPTSILEQTGQRAWRLKLRPQKWRGMRDVLHAEPVP